MKNNNELEVHKFFNYYQANGWKIGENTSMQDWDAIANNWVLKANEMKLQQNQLSTCTKPYPELVEGTGQTQNNQKQKLQ